MQGPFLAKAFRAQFLTFLIHCFKSQRAIVSPLFMVAVLIVFLACLVTTHPAAALSIDSHEHLLDYPDLPTKYGEVIYRINEKSPKQLYIIGISHRDPENSVSAGNTVQTQAEIFRIGEWLNRNMHLELLLPEGYFRRKGGSARSVVHVNDNLPVSRMNNLLLFEKLADETRFVNAEMLLMEHFDMRASQVENRTIYNAVRGSLARLQADEFAKVSPAESIAELRYLQEIRTAMLMQEIPLAIENEILHGAIRNRSAMFTIGLNHLSDIIRYIDGEKIWINAPPYPAKQMENYNSELNLLKEGYGITVIIPRTLADDRRLLRLTNLDQILLAKENVPVSY